MLFTQRSRGQASAECRFPDGRSGAVRATMHARANNLDTLRGQTVEKNGRRQALAQPSIARARIQAKAIIASSNKCSATTALHLPILLMAKNLELFIVLVSVSFERGCRYMHMT